MTKAVFVAPIASKHFDVGVDFVESYNKHFDDDNLYLVFSNEKECQLFFDKLKEDIRFKYIVCDEELYCSKPMTQKKIFGVKWVYDNVPEVDYVGVIDVDSRFVRNFDYPKRFEEICDKKTIYGSPIADNGVRTKCIIDPARKFFNEIDFKIIQQTTKNFTIYTWFNEIPVYDRKYFYEFLDYIKYTTILPRLTYADFDFTLYTYFLYAKGYYKLEVMTTQNGDPLPGTISGSFVEDHVRSNMSRLIFEDVFAKYKPMWIRNPISENLMSNVFMRLHTDWK